MMEFIPKTDESSQKQLAGIGSFTERGKYPALHIETKGSMVHFYIPDDAGKIVWFTIERLQTLWTYAWEDKTRKPRAKKEPAPEKTGIFGRPATD